MNGLLQKYKDWMVLNGLTHSTISTYICHIKKILKKISIDSLNEENINAFFLGLREKYKAETINSHKNALKSFLKFLKKDIPLPKDIKIIRKLPETIDEKFFLTKLIPMVERISLNPLRCKALLYFMFYTGIRVSEAGSLQRKNIDLTNRTAKIYVKKGKEERMVFFNESTRDIMHKFFIVEPEEKNAFNMRTSSIKKLFQRLDKYFPDVHLFAHLFRHSLAVHFLMKGGDLVSLKELLGHKNIMSTMRYTGLTNKQLHEKYDKYIK